METKDIGHRLENWARWATGRAGGGADCMTGAICESMRKAALGNVWSGHNVRDEIDENDALLIERAICALPMKQLLLLHWCYVKNAPPHIVCRKLGIPQRPASVFVEQFREAQHAIEDYLDNEGNK